MQAGRCTAVQQPNHARFKHSISAPCILTGPLGGCGARHYAVKGVGTRALARAVPGQKDVTSELLERAFTLALTTRLKQYASINVDVRSTAWGLLEGKFGGMTVRGYNWRTPLELTAQQLMVDFGEMILDYQKLVWQQTVALKNVPQGSVSFTLTSQDLANFMVHPIMLTAAAKAIKGYEFVFDRNTASVRLDPATGRGVITYQGIWAGNGERYAVTMITPPLQAAAARPGSLKVASNTLEQLAVSARRVVPESATAAALYTTGSFASMGSADEQLNAAAAAGSSAAASSSRLQTMTVAPAGAAAVSAASAGLLGDESDPAAGLVAEGLRWFFSSLVLNMQGIEMRHPVLLVQLPGPGVGAAVTPGHVPPHPTLRQPPPAADSGPLPALLTITMKVAIRQLPPLNMKF